MTAEAKYKINKKGERMKKADKIWIIKWYIMNHTETEIDILNIDDINKLEEIVRTSPNTMGEISRCNGCTSDGKDYCKRCGNCIEWNWDKETKDVVDNYRFQYNYWKKFAISYERFQS